jgi:hypothetical protein
MTYPDERAFSRFSGPRWREHYPGLVRAGMFEVGPGERVCWKVYKGSVLGDAGPGYISANDYFTQDEAWDNVWPVPFPSEAEAVQFARKQAKIAWRVMKASRKAHGRVISEELAQVVNEGRQEPPAIFQ